MDNLYVQSYNNSDATSYDPDDVWKKSNEKELRYAGDTEVDIYYITKGINQANSIGHKGWLTLPVEYLLKKYKK